MTIKTDFHLHTDFSSDSDTPMEDMIQRALELGLSRLCFTEHMDPDFPVNPRDNLDFQLDTQAYRNRFLIMKEAYSHELKLLFGVEVGLQPHLSAFLKDYTRCYPFDFVIGSTHISNRIDPYYPEYYEGRTQEAAYREYFETTLANIRACDDFDVYGHLDYVVRYGPSQDTFYTYEKYADLIDAILTELIQKGKGLEVNTGGLKYGLKEVHPYPFVLKRYRSLGGEIITIGSDAHKPDRLCAHFDQARDTLMACGFTHYTVFENRSPQFIPL